MYAMYAQTKGNQTNLSATEGAQSAARNRSVVLAGPTMCAKTVGLNDMHLILRILAPEIDWLTIPLQMQTVMQTPQAT